MASHLLTLSIRSLNWMVAVAEAGLLPKIFKRYSKITEKCALISRAGHYRAEMLSTSKQLTVLESADLTVGNLCKNLWGSFIQGQDVNWYNFNKGPRVNSHWSTNSSGV